MMDIDCKCGKPVWYDGKCEKCFYKSRRHENIVNDIEKLLSDFEIKIKRKETIIAEIKNILKKWDELQ